jgi:hypothetical protein
MIPAGYVDSLVAWATRPDLASEVKAERRTLLLAEHDRLVTGQLNGKASRTMISGSANGKSFTWDSDITAAEKSVVITAVLRRLGLLDASASEPAIVYGDFRSIAR